MIACRPLRLSDRERSLSLIITDFMKFNPVFKSMNNSKFIFGQLEGYWRNNIDRYLLSKMSMGLTDNAKLIGTYLVSNLDDDLKIKSTICSQQFLNLFNVIEKFTHESENKLASEKDYISPTKSVITRALAIDSEYHGKGYSLKIMANAETYIKQRGFESIRYVSTNPATKEIGNKLNYKSVNKLDLKTIKIKNKLIFEHIESNVSTIEYMCKNIV